MRVSALLALSLILNTAAAHAATTATAVPTPEEESAGDNTLQQPTLLLLGAGAGALAAGLLVTGVLTAGVLTTVAVAHRYGVLPGVPAPALPAAAPNRALLVALGVGGALLATAVVATLGAAGLLIWNTTMATLIITRVLRGVVRAVRAPDETPKVRRKGPCQRRTPPAAPAPHARPPCGCDAFGTWLRADA